MMHSISNWYMLWEESGVSFLGIPMPLLYLENLMDAIDIGRYQIQQHLLPLSTKANEILFMYKITARGNPAVITETHSIAELRVLGDLQRDLRERLHSNRIIDLAVPKGFWTLPATDTIQTNERRSRAGCFKQNNGKAEAKWIHIEF